MKTYEYKVGILKSNELKLLNLIERAPFTAVVNDIWIADKMGIPLEEAHKLANDLIKAKLLSFKGDRYDLFAL